MSVRSASPNASTASSAASSETESLTVAARSERPSPAASNSANQSCHHCRSGEASTYRLALSPMKPAWTQNVRLPRAAFEAQLPILENSVSVLEKSSFSLALRAKVAPAPTQ